MNKVRIIIMGFEYIINLQAIKHIENRASKQYKYILILYKYSDNTIYLN